MINKRSQLNYYSSFFMACWLFFALSPSLASDPLRMAVLQAQEPLPPFIWYDSCQQQATGVIPKLLETLINEAGYQLTSVVDKPLINLRDQELQVARFKALLDNELDIFYSTKLYAEDPAVIIGDSPLVSLQLILLVSKPLKDFTRFDQLDNYQGSFSGVQNSQQHIALQSLGLNMLTATSFDQQITWLKQQKIDYAIMEKRIAKYAIKKYQLKGDFFISPIQMGRPEIFLYTRKGSEFENFIRFSNQRLKIYRRSGILDNLIYHQLNRWFETPSNCFKRSLIDSFDAEHT